MSNLQKTLLVLLGVPVLLATGFCILLWLAIDNKPTVISPAAVDYQTVASSKALLKRLLQQVESPSSSTTLVVSESELMNLARMGSHSVPELNAAVTIVGERLWPAASLELPATPFGDFLNVSFQVPSSQSQLHIRQLRIGDLTIPGSWLIPAVTFLADLVVPGAKLTPLLDSVASIKVGWKTAFVTLKAAPSGSLKSDIKQTVRRLQTLRFPAGEQTRVLHYYDFLASDAPADTFRPHSLATLLRPLMTEAAKQSPGGSAINENRAAILALAIYLSYGKFENLTGDMVSTERPLVAPPFNVTLQNRRDLMQHFVYSAAITLATRQGIGIAAGEFKELLDSGDQGGSGFSFTDLAADRAGVLFAEAAVATELRAKRVQQAISNTAGEAAFFPDISGLEDGLTDAEFTSRYQSTLGSPYLEEIARIDDRITTLPVYQ